MSKTNKIIITLIGLALIVLAQSKTLDQLGLEHTEQGLKRALITYGVSRGINGVISVVQGTEVAIEPVGVGMTFTPGQILDPINDLIERFSTVVLVSGTAFGVQRVFLEVFSAQLFSVLVAMIVLSALLILWRRNWLSPKWTNLLFKTATIMLLIRFSVPAVAIFSENFYQMFLAPQFETSSQQLAVTTKELESLQSQATMSAGTPSGNTNESIGFLESAKQLYQSASNSLDMSQHLDDISAAAENVSENAIKLMVVFLFQTIILPLLSVWLLLSLLKWLAFRFKFE